MVMGCQPSRLVFTGLPFEASRPGAGGTLLPSGPACQPQPAHTQVLPCTHSHSACRRLTRTGG